MLQLISFDGVPRATLPTISVIFPEVRATEWPSQTRLYYPGRSVTSPLHPSVENNYSSNFLEY